MAQKLPFKIPPGLIALLYKLRWGVEKSFDEMKNKLLERREARKEGVERARWGNSVRETAWQR
jgi:IS4 transposase